MRPLRFSTSQISPNWKIIIIYHGCLLQSFFIIDGPPSFYFISLFGIFDGARLSPKNAPMSTRTKVMGVPFLLVFFLHSIQCLVFFSPHAPLSFSILALFPRYRRGDNDPVMSRHWTHQQNGRRHPKNRARESLYEFPSSTSYGTPGRRPLRVYTGILKVQ